MNVGDRVRVRGVGELRRNGLPGLSRFGTVRAVDNGLIGIEAEDGFFSRAVSGEVFHLVWLEPDQLCEAPLVRGSEAA